jgi:hypothetical protein
LTSTLSYNLSRVKKIAFEIVEIYAISFLKAPLIQEKKIHYESLQMQNKFKPIKQNGKRKYNFSSTFNPYNQDIIQID